MKQLTLLLLTLLLTAWLISCTTATPEKPIYPESTRSKSEPEQTVTRSSPTENSIPLKMPFDIWSTEVSPEADETKMILESADIPVRDLIEVTNRLGNPQEPIPKVVRSEPWGFEIGDQHQFWILNWDTGEYSLVSGSLVYSTPHTFTFLQDELKLDQEKLTRLIDHFETDTYATNRRYFGSEWNPGVDHDPHLIILFAQDIASSYQNSIDEYSQQVHPNSNEMEIIYIDAEGDWEGDDCMLAHEFQHTIQWAVDPDEETWMNEGFSVLACQLNGIFPGGVETTLNYLAPQADIQLNAWSGEADQVFADFSASYLFLVYFVDRFGEDALRPLAAEQKNGLESVDQVLKSINSGLSADNVFADWVVTNYLNDPELENGRYRYSTYSRSPFEAEVNQKNNELPFELQTDVAQYGADYTSLTGDGEYQIDFTGSSQVGLGPASVHSGKYTWWSGRGTNSDTTLTKEFDLTSLKKASLSFFTWYDILQDHDYAYVEISTEGQEWTTLPAQNTTTSDPNEFNYGHGYTGASNGWIQQKIDLAPFVGQKVKLRFEYLTDDGPGNPGFFVDDIEIPELGYRYDSETDNGGWVANGFMRTAGILPQEWLVQLIIQGEEEVTIERLQLNPDNTGSWMIDLRSNETAIIIISGLTRGTTERAQYWYRMKSTNDQQQ
jgi:immune inhibitor A